MNNLVKFLDGSDERGGLHSVFFRATVGATGALTVTRSSPSVASVARTAAGSYTVTFDSAWVTMPSSLDVSPLYDFEAFVIVSTGAFGVDGTDVYLMQDNSANQDAISGPILKIKAFPRGSNVATDIHSGDELVCAFRLATSLV